MMHLLYILYKRYASRLTRDEGFPSSYLAHLRIVALKNAMNNPYHFLEEKKCI
jgi:hypothetical protein